MFLLRVSRTKRSSENSNEKSGSVLARVHNVLLYNVLLVLVYILTKQSECK